MNVQNWDLTAVDSILILLLYDFIYIPYSLINGTWYSSLLILSLIYLLLIRKTLFLKSKIWKYLHIITQNLHTCDLYSRGRLCMVKQVARVSERKVMQGMKNRTWTKDSCNKIRLTRKITHGRSQSGHYSRVVLTLVGAIYLRYLPYIFFLLLAAITCCDWTKCRGTMYKHIAQRINRLASFG